MQLLTKEGISITYMSPPPPPPLFISVEGGGGGGVSKAGQDTSTARGVLDARNA